MITSVIVGVALGRPPKVDEFRRIVVEARDRVDAMLLACQIAACTSVMPVCAQIEHDTDAG